MDPSTNKLIGDMMGLTPKEQRLCDIAGSHDYNCECGACLEWWRGVGPDPGTDLTRPYGGFSIERVEDDSEEGQWCRMCRLLLHIENKDGWEHIRFVTEDGFTLHWCETGGWTDGDLVFDYEEGYLPIGVGRILVKGRLEWVDG